MRMHFHPGRLSVVISSLLLLAPALASAQGRPERQERFQMLEGLRQGPKMVATGTQISFDYPAQFERAVLRVRMIGQTDVWTETFDNAATVSRDLAVWAGGAVGDGMYRYEIALTWPGRAQPQTATGVFRVDGGRIVTESSGPTPQADSWVDGNLRVHGGGCFGCLSDTTVWNGTTVAVDTYNVNLGAVNALAAFGVHDGVVPSVWQIGNSLHDFIIEGPSTFVNITGGTGDIGVGTFNPAGEFHISKPNTNVDLFLERSGTNPSIALFSAQPDSVAFGTLSADPFLIATNNVARIIIGAGGGVNVNGDFGVSGVKNFVEDHPTDPTKSIHYASIEGPEAATFLRGSATLVKGRAVIDLPEHFGLVTADEGLTVQLTPRGEWLQAYVAEVTPHRLVLRARGGKSGRIDYLVIGVRKGYTDYQVIRSKANEAK